MADLDQLQERPILAFEKDFLRWMLSDGAAALLISEKMNRSAPSLRVEWIDITSYANEMETCMYLGADKRPDASLQGWAEYAPAAWLSRSIFALKQDVRMLDQAIVNFGTRNFVEVLRRRQCSVDEIDYFLPHVSSAYFIKKVDEEMQRQHVGVPMEKWFVNLTRLGNVGSASIFLALEELFNSGKLKAGEKIFLTVPESARFSYANALLTVC